MTYCLRSIRQPDLKSRIISLGLRVKTSTIWTGHPFVEKRNSPTKLLSRRDTLKKDHESKLMDLVLSQSSSTEPDQDQERQAQIGLLGIEPTPDIDPENEEDGTVPFLYPSHISDASPQAKRAWQVIENWMSLENPTPTQGEKNPVTFVERKRRLAVCASSEPKRSKTDDDASEPSRQGEMEFDRLTPLTARFPVLSYRYTGRRRRQGHHRRTTTTTTKKPQKKKKDNENTQKTTSYNREHNLTTETTGTATGTTTTTTKTTLVDTPPSEPAETVATGSRRDDETRQTACGTVTCGPTQPVNRLREKRRRKRARHRTLRENNSNSLSLSFSFPILYSAPKNSTIKQLKTTALLLRTHAHDIANASENRSDAEYAINADRLYI